LPTRLVGGIPPKEGALFWPPTRPRLRPFSFDCIFLRGRVAPDPGDVKRCSLWRTMPILESEDIAAGGRGSADTAQAAQFEWNLQTDNWNWESSVLDVYGASAEDSTANGTAFLSLKHPDDVRTRRVMMQMLESGKAGSYVHRIFREDGSVRQVSSSAFIRFDTRERPDVMQGTVEVVSSWEHPLSGCDLANASDGILMLCFRARMPDALAEAFRRHGGAIDRFVRQLRYPSVNADDVVQDVFEGLCRKQGGFDARRGSLAWYLRMQARSSCIDQVRSHAKRRTRELAHNPVATSHSAEDDALSTLSRQCIRIALADLDDAERIPIELAYMSGLSYRAVAVHLSVPEGTVKARIRSGLRKLRSSADLANLTVG
jgi:RNA polymerase sigma-70 factor (ECF subfamily)